MVVKTRNGLPVDVARGLVGDHLLKIRGGSQKYHLELVPVWKTEIPARESAKVLAHQRQLNDPINLNHVNRFVNRNKPPLLDFLICSHQCLSSEEAARAYMSKVLSVDNIETVMVPRYAPLTKEQNRAWSEQYWPLSWRGNPETQSLMQVDIDETVVRRHLATVAQLGRENVASGGSGVAALFVDPSGVVRSSAVDLRDPKRPLAHCVIRCIEEISAQERRLKNESTEKAEEVGKPQPELSELSEHEKQPESQLEAQSGLQTTNISSKTIENSALSTHSPTKSSTQSSVESSESSGYLCLNFDVYTTHEPCVMCCMALVHSRVRRIVYLCSTPATGGLEAESGAGWGIHACESLNWHYEAWRWVDDAELCVDPVGEISV